MSGLGELRSLAGRLEECVHCGFCLPACPTYAELGTETDSPRGRIWLVRATAEGRIEPTADVLAHLDGCLVCRACETACPSGVRYGEIIEGAREALETSRRRPLRERFARRLALRWILPRSDRREIAARALNVGHRLGLLGAKAEALPIPGRWKRLARLAPAPEGRPFTSTAPPRVLAKPPVRGRVALFTGCVMDAVMPEVHRATVRVLSHQGFEVVVPGAQTCCGALHAHNGDGDGARQLALRNLDAFESVDVETILVNSAGCGAHLRELPVRFAEGTEIRDRARRLARRTQDVLAFLAEKGLRAAPVPCEARAVYDEPCHLLHAQGISAAPRALLEQVPGLTVLPLPEADACCGSAGVYNVTHPEMAERLLARKMDAVASTGADLLLTANPGCLLQLRAGARSRRMPIRVAHVLEMLDPRPA